MERYERGEDGTLTILSARAEDRRSEWHPGHERLLEVTYAPDGEVERIFEPRERYELYRRKVRRRRIARPQSPGALNPLGVIDEFAALLEQAGLSFIRTPGEQGDELTGDTHDRELVLDLFCRLARMPVAREVDRDGDLWIVPDDQDTDLLLHVSGVETRYADEGVDEEGPSFYAVSFSRQLTFEDEDGEYLGMRTFQLSLETDGVPEGRVPTAQRWEYADLDRCAGRLRSGAGRLRFSVRS